MKLNRRRLGMVCLQGGRAASVLLLLIFAVLALVLRPGSAALRAGQPVAPGFVPPVSSTGQVTQILAAYGQLPLTFEPNQGQSSPEVKFLARGAGYTLFLTQTESVLTLRHSAARTQHSASRVSVLRMGLANANRNPDIDGNNELPGRSNYLIGNDPNQWHRDVPHFARVRYSAVYPGIDLVYYGRQGKLEYDFEVAPGSDPSQVALRFEGADKLTLDSAGDLVLSANGDHVRLQSPRIYQRVGTEQRPISGAFELRSNHEVGFVLGAYDRNRTLIIDPLLTYSTYLGGSGDEACTAILSAATAVAGCPAIAVDTALNAYIAGATNSTNFPTAGSPHQPNLKGAADVFIAKFNSAANTLIFSTYLGGTDVDTSAGIAVDPGFNVVVAGNTASDDFPTNGTNAPFQATRLSAHNHVFLSQLDPAGHTLLYSTYLSGNGTDTATGLAVDPSGNAYVTGTTSSTEVQTGFPSTLGAYQTSSRAASQFFLTKVNPTMAGVDSVPYSTYFGGSTPSSGQTVGGGVAVDANSNAYFTGGTDFTNLPVLNAFQGAPAGGVDAFVAKLDPNAVTGTQLIYSTYVGGTGDDIANGIAVDASLNAYIVGSTTSTDFPGAGTGVFQASHNPTAGQDAFLAKFGPLCAGTNCTVTTVPLNYFTYLGGSGDDVALGIALDSNGSTTSSAQGARITGWTKSLDFPVLNNPVQSGFGGGVTDAFVARIDTTATTATAPGHYATYLGGGGDDYGTSIAADTQGASYVAGETSSADLLTKAPPLTNSFQPNLDGSTDAFVSKLGPVLSMSLTVSATPTPVGVGNQVTFTYTITNNGDFTSGVSFTDTLPTANVASFVSATANTGTNACGQPSGGTLLCNIGTLNAGATATVTVILLPVASTPPATSSVTLGNSGFVGVFGSSLASAATSVTVNDFDISASPASATVAAGVPATFTATITPTGPIPSSVSVSCTSGLPTGASCVPTTNNPIPNLNNGAASTVLVLNTTTRVTTTSQLRQNGGPLYATWLPVSGLAMLGVGIGRRVSRKRRVLMGLLLVAFFSLIFFQASCGGQKSTTTTTGTPAGTYVVTLSATSGVSATRTTTVTLVVQ